MKLTEINNPSAVGWRWAERSDDGERLYEICWPRGTHSLWFGTQADDGRWMTSTITEPERFGFDGTLKGARAAAQAFVFGSVTSESAEVTS